MKKGLKQLYVEYSLLKWHRQVNGGKGVTEHLFENYAAAMD
ncbi:hypothetical protein Bandiella_01318 [Candidatus Bandiella woodruffii]|uniref:Transposase n=1 Tax=Candidatus Bandiella euplotis TaxID=1664265 RepID=A0ABZ0UN78_9RICK|nr:hypothetical protein Bandiella_01318 [Candidatus Bandiella woodruffii]